LLEEAKYQNDFFDIIALFQTFEHFVNPTQGLAKIKGLLKSNGLLFVEVPDALSIDGVYRGFDPSPYHLYIYTTTTLKSLLNKCGFQIVSSRIFDRNIQIVAKKYKAVRTYQQAYKSHYKIFLLANFLNKRLLRIKLKLKAAIKRLIIPKNLSRNDCRRRNYTG